MNILNKSARALCEAFGRKPADENISDRLVEAISDGNEKKVEELLRQLSGDNCNQPKGKHFEFTGEVTKINGTRLRRIRATRDIEIHGVKRGDIGGWIEKEENLSDNAWVSGNARVYGDVKVYGDAWVYGGARVSGRVSNR